MNWTIAGGTTRLILVRHGEPEAGAAGLCYGRLDVGLSPRGASQALAAAAWLGRAPIAAVYASPSRRTVDSARPIASARGLKVQLRDEVRELDFGAFEGLNYDEVAARDPAVYAAWMADPTTVTFPDGESYAMLQARVLPTAAELRGIHADRTIALVAHSGVLRAILAAALGVADRDIFRIDIAHASVSVIDYTRDLTCVRLMNGAP